MSVRVDQPRPFDLVGSPVPIGGVGAGFEATLGYRVTDGHAEVTGVLPAGGGADEHDHYQARVEVATAGFVRERAVVEVFAVSAGDGSETDRVVVPVILGDRIVEGYRGYREHVVERGDTLASIAAAHYGDPALSPRLVAANHHVVGDPALIRPGQVIRVPVGA